MKRVSVVALMLVAAAGCPPPDKPAAGDKVGPASGKTDLAASADAGAAPADQRSAASKTAIGALPMNAPILIIDGVIYARSDIERAISQHAASTGMPPDELDVRMRDALEAPAFEKLIDRHLLSAEAKRRGLWPADDVVAAERERILRTLPPALTVEGFLNKLGTDEQGFAREIATDLALSKLFEALQKEQKAPDAAAVRKFYDDNKGRFVAPETASASHILVRLDRDAKPEAVQAAQQKAAAIRGEVAGKDKATFARLAVAKSDDPRAKDNKGDLGSFPRGAMVPELDDAAFKLKDGQVSEIVRSDFGLHILRGQGITKAGQRTFEEVKPMIAEREAGRSFMANLEVLIAGLRSKAQMQRLVEPAKSPLPSGGGAPPMGPCGPLPVPPAPSAPAAPTAPPVNVPPGAAPG